MKFSKLNMRGFSHEIVMVFVVVVVGISGVAYLVASHADSCSPVSGAVSQVSGSSCPVSSPVSSVVSNYAAHCFISGISAKPKYNQKLTAAIHVVNDGKQSFVPQFDAYFRVFDASGKVANPIHQTLSLKNLVPGQGRDINFPTTYTVPYSSATAVRGTFQATATGKTGGPAYTCTAAFTLPVK